MSDAVIRGIFQGLVLRIGGVDAAAAVIEAHAGVGHKGTVSRMCGGHAGVTISAVMALEGALGEYPLTEYLAAQRADGVAVPASLSSIAAQSALLAGQMQSALMLALADDGDGGAGITKREAGQVEASAAALISAARRVQAHVRGLRDGGLL